MPPDNPPCPPRAAITAVATYVPERTVTNAELATRLDTSDEWITSRTGIRQRRIGGPGETTSTMGSAAVRRLMETRGLGNSDVGALIVATVTPDMMFPATACLIQDQVGLRETWGSTSRQPVRGSSTRSRPARRSWRRECISGSSWWAPT